MLTVDIKHKGHGWLWVVIQAPSFEREFSASDVPQDSITQLAQALLYLLTYQGPATVVWNSEPVEHEFRFVRAGETVHLQVWEFPDSRRATSAGVAIGSVNGSLGRLLEPFVQALQRLGADQDFQAHWNRPFPAALLERVTQALAGRAG